VKLDNKAVKNKRKLSQTQKFSFASSVRRKDPLLKRMQNGWELGLRHQF
jgi:hypothetical protein